ncbi:MAG TPA: carbohydrate ABC transporter permease [Chthoniobacterales bacterium]
MRRARNFNGSIWKVVWLFIWIVILSIYLFPFAWMVMTGFRNPVDTYSWPPKFLFHPTLQGFHYLFAVKHFQGFLVNSVIVSVASTLLVILLGTPAAYASAVLPSGKKGFLLGLLIGRMMPAVALVVPVYLIASRWHLLDTYQVLVAINVAFNLPFAIWLTRSFFQDIPRELREAAILDGCSEFSVFHRIFVPLCAGGIAAAAVFTFIAAWNEFLFALTLTNTRAATAPVVALGFRTQFGIQWGAAGAAALLISAPVIVFAMIMQKYLLRGMTLGAVK